MTGKPGNEKCRVEIQTYFFFLLFFIFIFMIDVLPYFLSFFFFCFLFSVRVCVFFFFTMVRESFISRGAPDPIDHIPSTLAFAVDNFLSPPDRLSTLSILYDTPNNYVTTSSGWRIQRKTKLKFLAIFFLLDVKSKAIKVYSFYNLLTVA